jgi:hypothetical protein
MLFLVYGCKITNFIHTLQMFCKLFFEKSKAGGGDGELPG